MLHENESIGNSYIEQKGEDVFVIVSEKRDHFALNVFF